MDVLFLSRLQFAGTVMFHYLFPPLTIGLSAIMVYLEGQYLRTGDPEYEVAARFWTRIFAVNFAMGVATGIVMEFQFGTNWSTYSRFVGDVFGSALAAEGIFAFFLESGFLAVLVFGWDRVSAKMHFFATLMVSGGGIFSAVWIVVANSWQQTPAGFHLVTRGGATRAEITDFWAMVLNPSSVIRLSHVLVGAFILGAFFVMSIAAWYVLHDRHREFARRTFGGGLALGLLASLLAPLTGDIHGRIVAEHQPTKLAAMEGLYTTPEAGAPLHVFGVVDHDAREVRYDLSIPGGLSFLVHRDPDRPVSGLDRFPEDEWPPVPVTFYSFHLMVGLGALFIVLTAVGLWHHRKGTLFERRWLLWIFVFAVVGPYAANQLGWVTAEVGRQPWSVWGLLRTEDSFSANLGTGEVLGSLAGFGLIYALLLLVWVFVLNDKIQHGPEPGGPPDHPTAEGLLDTAASQAAHRRSLTSDRDDRSTGREA
ncbi:MAG: cytochrome ubiquinol oxidase subunit I [Gemmatimonadota bacterium]|jgi:cytochrome d ubiquinol oxidase subunit I